jgi:site-specific DNA-methyltransferase (adenine-specific)
MKDFPDKSINLILCDLPYAETGNKWDFPVDPKELWLQYERIIKDDGAIVLTGTFKFGIQLYLQAPHLYKYDWIWEKDNGTNVVAANHQPLRVHENVFVFGKRAVTFTPRGRYMKYNPQKTEGNPYRCVSGKQSSNWKGGTVENFETNNESGLRHPRTVQKFIRDKDKLHPTQKPVALFEFLIKSYTDEGDLVLDNTCGSGTTGVAAKNTNRNCILVEKEKEYCEIAAKRTGFEILNDKKEIVITPNSLKEIPLEVEIKVNPKECNKIKPLNNVCECGGEIKDIDGGRMCELCFKEYEK